MLGSGGAGAEEVPEVLAIGCFVGSAAFLGLDARFRGLLASSYGCCAFVARDWT